MLALNKTKAALQSRLSQLTTSNSSAQDITGVDQVNSASGTGIPVTEFEFQICNSMHEAFQVSVNHRQKILTWSLVGFGQKKFLSASRASLRWRRLISFWIAEFINCPVLSPSTLTCCIPSINSCAIRAVTDCDLAFFEPVAICTFSDRWCKTIYTSFIVLKELTCKTPVIYRVSYTFLVEGVEIAKPGSATTLTGPLTKPLYEVTIMAEPQSTQTRPEFTYDTKFFTWRFMSLSATERGIIHITATSEREARDQSPSGCVMIFAARLPAEVIHA